MGHSERREGCRGAREDGVGLADGVGAEGPTTRTRLYWIALNNAAEACAWGTAVAIEPN